MKSAEATTPIEEVKLKKHACGRVDPFLRIVAHGSAKIAQINHHHAKAASAVIARASSEKNIGIVLAQKPWVYRGQIRGLQGRNIQVIWDSSCEKPRACIILKRNLKYICLSEFLKGDLVAIQLPHLLGCDANAHYEVWESSDTNHNNWKNKENLDTLLS
ncbi:uncharacterized protein LOC119656993 [Hermetia illucens]|uniref:uncharacterized protein LOC119656993 n=1 Tax=Hermetia illucens TaxID=343691 RepID=UPI0018CC5378|nr:uncharacterized protein LOC119656993 [Hermetia illucens]